MAILVLAAVAALSVGITLAVVNARMPDACTCSGQCRSAGTETAADVEAPSAQQTEPSEADSISIPGFDFLSLQAGAQEQSMPLYNLSLIHIYCHCEGASRPWQSHAPTSEFAEVALLSPRVLRDCHVGLRPPRNDTSGEHGAGNGALHRISRPIAASRTGYRYPKFICPRSPRNRPHRPRGARLS